MKLTHALLAAAAFIAGAHGAAMEVIDPTITSPQAGDTWTVGEQRNVTWDTSLVPPGNTQTGQILLGFLTTDSNGSVDEHLQVDSPLATGFLLSAGWATVTVPNVEDRDDYIVDLMGDSGNVSPKFTIEHSLVDFLTPPKGVMETFSKVIPL